jgi:hypothetical protein
MFLHVPKTKAVLGALIDALDLQLAISESWLH